MFTILALYKFTALPSYEMPIRPSRLLTEAKRIPFKRFVN
jgi:hypothetical protein